MITDTKDGQTNYCPNCEDQARRIEELERHDKMLVNAMKDAWFFAGKGDVVKAYDYLNNALNATPSHSAAWEWNQHVEWCKNNLVQKCTQYWDNSHGKIVDDPLYAIPELKEVDE